MNIPRIILPRISNHGSEIMLLALIGGGVIWLLAKVIDKGVTGWDVAACLLVLQGIVTAIKDRWVQRSTDRMTEQLGQSQPPSDQPQPVTVENKPNQPIPVEETKP